ncbi:hypothetical protein C0J52_14863 [Blattella germanica]|nr:hypothetical protein C0J52_14863 [Blattella germanica]
MAPKKFSLEHRVFIFECYIKKKNCGAVRRRFARKFPDDPIPSKVTILNLVKKFRETGSLLNKCGKRDPSVLTKAKLYEIKDRLEHSPRNSLRLLSQETGVSKTTAFRATKALKLKPNKVTTVQELHAIDVSCMAFFFTEFYRPRKPANLHRYRHESVSRMQK